MKASDITDAQIYSIIAARTLIRGYAGVGIWDIEENLSNFPVKIVHAKLAQMVRKRRLAGCACGCRGDFCFPWQEFGDKPDVEAWDLRIPKYLKKRTRIKTPART